MAITVNVNVKADFGTLWAIDPPIQIAAGDTLTVTVTYLGASSVSTPVGTIYQGSKDVSATCMPTGTASASGNVITLKPITAVVGNKKYVVTVATAEYPTKKFQLRVQKASTRQ